MASIDKKTLKDFRCFYCGALLAKVFVESTLQIRCYKKNFMNYYQSGTCFIEDPKTKKLLPYISTRGGKKKK